MDYAKSAASALAIIKKNGKEYVISRSRPAFDDVTGEPADSTPLTGKLTAVVLPRYKGPAFDSLDDGLKEALIKGKTRTVLAAAKGVAFVPEALDEVTINGTQWLVIGCSELNPAGVPIIYTIGVIQK